MRRRSFLALAAAVPLVGQKSQRAGFAERDITPVVGTEQPGNYMKQFHKSVHDPCKVRAAVFDDGAARVALVGVDALMVPRQMVTGARDAIARRCGIAPEAVLIGASHSHSSGPTGMVQPGEYDHAPADVQELAYRYSSAADPAYLKVVETAIVEAVCAANDGRQESRWGFGSGIEDKVLFNRRFRMKNGRTFTHPRQGNPEIVEVAGPVDPAVTVTAAFDGEGKVRGCVVNYACHATTNPSGASANWVYYMERALRGYFGADLVVVFLAGFAGDVTQVDNLSPVEPPSGEQQAQLVGGSVGAEAVKVILRMAPGEGLPVRSAATVYQQTRRPVDAARLARAREVVAMPRDQAGAANWVFAKEYVMYDAHRRKWPRVEVEVQALQIGPALYTGAPGEIFTRFGLDIRGQSGFPLVSPVSLANGSLGYVPTPDALAEGGGGYEQRITSYTNLTADAGDRMVRAAVELARRWKPAAIPARPPARRFAAPWDYGAAGPEPR